MADFSGPLPGAEPDSAALIAARPHLTMDAEKGLMLEGVALAEIAADLGSPVWVYGADTIRTRLAALRAALTKAGLGGTDIHYAVKANDHLAILAVLAAAGAGADVVSGGELARARHAGIPAAHIVYSGVGKSFRDLTLAVSEGIGQVNVESREELAMLSAVAVAAGRQVDLVLRVNPDVDAKTHAKITTGLAENKFGIAWAEVESVYAYAGSLPGLNPVGLAMHIGSQIVSTEPFDTAFARMAGMVARLRAAGHTISRLDCGGGIGISYEAGTGVSLDDYAGVMAKHLGGLGLHLMMEPGRWLVGPAGVLLSSVIIAKKTGNRDFVVLDAAMNDLVRPAMYDAWHGIVPVAAAVAAGPQAPVDIVGPVCETGDTFAKDRLMPALGPDALVAILDAGAYGAVMSSTYNARPFAAAALVDGDRWTTITPRQQVTELWSRETVPAWLTETAGETG
ncbi:diaminopimelate decarboxylase [Acidisoma cellulosilytica]|uniref:Diaminopimelate decarboxylase n=1 Tax=Acidisoma cellulosilyticum TaxID=2802395 RepID=A0A964E671_9PROT|nr:diaminopimelate decarboxylase [Acidisoma cellulosilyticum]MCB8883289.1 diaminopimelate decarboxylase [Acidisoma cellulosilyticum]